MSGYTLNNYHVIFPEFFDNFPDLSPILSELDNMNLWKQVCICPRILILARPLLHNQLFNYFYPESFYKNIEWEK